ncbi:krueppel like ous 1 [Fusarium longipes]|uniref:Krueppel like ous 1 n=1 Tax=Fusarium longipes TaxID=694270 RepID=A0A395RFS0_9HYPO|nr:krueppel like ous 1 [Fusarium longipes]
MAPRRSKKSGTAPVSDGKQSSITSFFRPQPAATEPVSAPRSTSTPSPEPSPSFLARQESPRGPEKRPMILPQHSQINCSGSMMRMDDDDSDLPVIDEDPDDQDYDPANDIDPAELDEFEELEDVLGENSSATIQEIVAVDLAAPLVEASGLVRVGHQPAESQKMVISAPKKIARRIFGHRMTVNHEVTDRHFPGCDRRDLTQERKNNGPSNGGLSRVCDYTGLETSWTFGPHVLSVEAVYPLVVANNRIAYHGNPNVHIVDKSVNSAKRGDPAVFLPVLADWINAVAKPDFEVRRSRLSWGFNVVSNICIMNKIFHLSKKHSQEVKKWNLWSRDKKRAVLEAMQTGSKTSVVDQELSRYSVGDLFNANPNEIQSMKRSRYLVQGRNGYPTMLRISQKYGINKEEFEYHLTLLAPNGHDRVFYPFHVLSRPQARVYGWDWANMINLCERMVKNMQRLCNRHAEKAGYGEKGADGTVCLYWMVHLFCDKVRGLKLQRPAATTEEIRFHILDRWNFPMVPWKSNLLKASLCKGPDHGIAMRFGLVDEEIFDAENEIDLNKSTVVLDTWCTNSSMHNYAKSDWPSIPATIAAVPLHHSFFIVDLALGLEVWKGR